MDKSSPDGMPLPQRYGTILTIALELTMAVFDGVIANVALPTTASDFNASPVTSIWIVNVCQTAIVIALLPLSFFGDMVGYRRTYRIGLMVFIFTLLACVLSRSLDMLTSAHVAQGLGGVVLMSVNTVLTRLIYPQCFLGRGMGINSFVVAVPSAAGSMTAAAIFSFASWQQLSLVNVPLGIVAFALIVRFLPPNSVRSRIICFNLSSVTMNVLTFGLLIIALNGFAQGQSVQLALAEVAVMLVVSSFFVHRQLSIPVPLLPVDPLRIPFSSPSICTSIRSFCAQMLAMVFLPFFLQTMMGCNEVETGLLLTPWPLATMVVVLLAGYLIEKYHAGLLGTIELLVIAYGLFGLALLPESPSDLDIVWCTVLCGAGFGLFQSPDNYTIVASVPSRRSGDASRMLGIARLLGQSTGAALVVLLFNLLGNSGTYTVPLLAGILVTVAALINGLRVTQLCVA